MSDLRYIKPGAKLRVPEPTTLAPPLPAHGKGVVWSSYWQRRLDDGDVIETDRKSIDAAEKKTTDEKKTTEGDGK